MGSNTLATEVSMADFDLETFVSAPTVEQLDKCRKDDLLRIAAHFQIAVLKQRLKKEIKSTVIPKVGGTRCFSVARRCWGSSFWC